jgi:hypothetical protein
VQVLLFSCGRFESGIFTLSEADAANKNVIKSSERESLMLCCAPFFLIPRTCAADCETGGVQSTTFFLSLSLSLSLAGINFTLA